MRITESWRLKAYVVRADEKLTAFVELESPIRQAGCPEKTSHYRRTQKPL